MRSEIDRDGQYVLSVEGDAYIMSGGRYGEHRLSVSCTSPARLAAHWRGYCQQGQERSIADVFSLAEPNHSIPYDGCACGDAFCHGCEE